MSHDHHGHEHSHGANKRALFISFIIITCFMIVEAIGGYLSNSLALLSDAGHMLSDSISLGIGVLAFTLSEKMANYGKTYGYKRFEILAAVFNGVTLVIIALFIIYEAFSRMSNPPEVASMSMLIIAAIGLLVNILVAWIIMREGDTKENLNVHAAFLHVIGDMLGSVGAIVASLLILFFGWGWADPVASLVVAILILNSGWRVIMQSLHVLMEGTPKNMNVAEIAETIKNMNGVQNIHDLHVWSITSGQNALSCHIVVDGKISVDESQSILRAIEHALEHKNIQHVTIQVENNLHPHPESLLCQQKFEPQIHVHEH